MVWPFYIEAAYIQDYYEYLRKNNLKITKSKHSYF